MFMKACEDLRSFQNFASLGVTSRWLYWAMPAARAVRSYACRGCPDAHRGITLIGRYPLPSLLRNSFLLILCPGATKKRAGYRCDLV